MLFQSRPYICDIKNSSRALLKEPTSNVTVFTMLEHVGRIEVLTRISFHLSNNTYTNLDVCVCDEVNTPPPPHVGFPLRTHKR